VLIFMTSVVANLPEGPPIWNNLGPRKWKFASECSWILMFSCQLKTTPIYWSWYFSVSYSVITMLVSYFFIHSFSFLLFLWGGSRGQQSLEDSKYLTINSNLGIVLLALRQGGTKQGRRCSHSTWSLDDLLAAFSWV